MSVCDLHCLCLALESSVPVAYRGMARPGSCVCMCHRCKSYMTSSMYLRARGMLVVWALLCVPVVARADYELVCATRS